MRAANYFHAAGYMFDGGPQSPDHDRVVAYGEYAAQNFCRGALLLPGQVFPLEIPFEDGLNLPGYFYMPPSHARRPGKNPVLIGLNGADSIQEEVYFMQSRVLDAGYALLTFDGPGQGMVLRQHQQHIRGDFEVVISRVLDFLFGFAGQHRGLALDLDRIALAGASMGGYFALQGAADPRVKACVALDAFYDMWDFAAHYTSPALLSAWQSGWIPTRGGQQTARCCSVGGSSVALGAGPDTVDLWCANPGRCSPCHEEIHSQGRLSSQSQVSGVCKLSKAVPLPGAISRCKTHSAGFSTFARKPEEVVDFIGTRGGRTPSQSRVIWVGSAAHNLVFG